ncbi:uncharacterized protein DMENIID0001_159960 [Sergentomyia squamirostris]
MPPKKRKNVKDQQVQTDSSVSSKRAKIDPKRPSLHMLNDDCLEEVFRKLELQDLFKLEMVCKRFREVTMKVYKYCTTLNCDSLLIYCKKNQQKHLEAMASKVGNYVENLKLSAEVKDNDSGRKNFLSILGKCKNVKHLRISRAKNDIFFFYANNALNRTFSGLKTLQLDSCRFDDEAGEYILKADQLEELDLSYGVKIYGSWFSEIRNLKKVRFGYSLSLDVDQFTTFCENNPDLESIFFHLGDDFNNRRFNAITSNLKNLQQVELSGRSMYNCIRLNHIKNLVDLPKLKHLKIRGIGNLAHLVSFLDLRRDTLESLDLSFYPRDGDCDPRVVLWGISRLSLPRLKKLSTDYGMYDNILEQLRCTETLEEVSMVGSEVTDDSVCQFIKKCKKLTSLNLTGCPNLTSDLITGILPALKERSQTLTIFAGTTGIYNSEKSRKNPKINISRKNKDFSLRDYKELNSADN